MIGTKGKRVEDANKDVNCKCRNTTIFDKYSFIKVALTIARKPRRWSESAGCRNSNLSELDNKNIR